MTVEHTRKSERTDSLGHMVALVVLVLSCCLALFGCSSARSRGESAPEDPYAEAWQGRTDRIKTVACTFTVKEKDGDRRRYTLQIDPDAGFVRGHTFTHYVTESGHRYRPDRGYGVSAKHVWSSSRAGDRRSFRLHAVDSRRRAFSSRSSFLDWHKLRWALFPAHSRWLRRYITFSYLSDEPSPLVAGARRLTYGTEVKLGRLAGERATLRYDVTFDDGFRIHRIALGPRDTAAQVVEKDDFRRVGPVWVPHRTKFTRLEFDNETGEIVTDENGEPKVLEQWELRIEDIEFNQQYEPEDFAPRPEVRDVVHGKKKVEIESPEQLAEVRRAIVEGEFELGDGPHGTESASRSALHSLEHVEKLKNPEEAEELRRKVKETAGNALTEYYAVTCKRMKEHNAPPNALPAWKASVSIIYVRGGRRRVETYVPEEPKGLSQSEVMNYHKVLCDRLPADDMKALEEWVSGRKPPYVTYYRAGEVKTFRLRDGEYEAGPAHGSLRPVRPYVWCLPMRYRYPRMLEPKNGEYGRLVGFETSDGAAYAQWFVNPERHYVCEVHEWGRDYNRKIVDPRRDLRVSDPTSRRTSRLTLEEYARTPGGVWYPNRQTQVDFNRRSGKVTYDIVNHIDDQRQVPDFLLDPDNFDPQEFVSQ